MPELFIHLKADEGTVADHLSTRDRINIASAEDTPLFDSFLDEWLESMPAHQMLTLNISRESEVYESSTKAILEYINKMNQP